MRNNTSMLINSVTNYVNSMAMLQDLKVDANCYFFKLLQILEYEVKNFRKIKDYTFLIQIANSLRFFNNRLPSSVKKRHRDKIINVKRLCEEKIKYADDYNKKILKEVIKTLEILLVKAKRAELIYETIFNFRKLDYLDKVIEADKSLLNIKVKDSPIFILVLKGYLETNTRNSIYYFERVINKFLLEDEFDLENVKSKALELLEEYLSNVNIDIFKAKSIKRVIECIKKRENLFKEITINPQKENILLEKQKEIIGDRVNDRVYINDYIVTIDDNDALVLDDALSFSILANGNIVFKVHIADILAYFDYNSSLIQEAKLKSSTIYLTGDTQIPMIPLDLSGYSLSLVEGKERLAKTFCFEFDKDYNLVNTYFLNSIIRVSKRESYLNLNRLYKLGGTSKEEAERLEVLYNILSSFRKIFRNVENYERSKLRKSIHGNMVDLSDFAEQLVAHSMVSVGYETSKFFAEKQLPFAYRCQKIDKNWLKLLNNLHLDTSNPEYLKILKSVNSGYPKSYYSSMNSGHLGLDISSYSHATSPLRRFCDILNHLALDTCYFKDPTDIELDNLLKEIQEVTTYLNMQRNTNEEAMKEFNKERVLKLEN